MPLLLAIKVVPQSGRSGFELDKHGNLKVYLKKPAQHGMANQELIKTVAKALGIAHNKVELVAGAHHRNKKLLITLDISFEDMLALLRIEVQQKIL
jgi:uncharacterized protein (TIGR00251 family)